MSVADHNLNIYMYSFDEILDLFDLTYNITAEDMKRAKKTVLMTHPDKSQLSSDYFLFYKKAFDMVLTYYQNQTKQHQAVTKENTQYQVPVENHSSQIKSTIQEIKPEVFQQTFNELFEKNMGSAPQKTDKNDWFYKEEPIYKIDEKQSKANLNQGIETIKQQQQQGMIQYQGVSHLYSSGGTHFYDDLGDDDTSTYISSDPFSKLKFDDLRKVHKDQTVFAVSENDFSKMKTYASVEQMNRERGSQNLTPMQKETSEKILAEQQRIRKETMAQKQFESALKTKKYEETNKSVLSAFLRLT